MNKQDVLRILSVLNNEQQVDWMVGLGTALTVYARDTYDRLEPVNTFKGFNEIHHHVYARIRDLKRGHDWTLESFLDGTMEKARHYGLEGEVGGALRFSIRSLVDARIVGPQS